MRRSDLFTTLNLDSKFWIQKRLCTSLTKNNVITMLYQIFVTLVNFLGTLPKVVWFNYQFNLPPKFFDLTFFLLILKTPFHGNTTKIEKNGHNSATAHATCKFFFQKMQNAQVPICSQWIISV